MSVSATLVIVIAASELNSPATSEMLNAARETLGAATQLRLETSDAPTLTLPQPDDQRSYVVVSWQGPSHETAQILGRRAGASQPSTRRLTFDAADPESERGRSVGFVIASIFVSNVSAPPPHSPDVVVPDSTTRPVSRRLDRLYTVALAAAAGYPSSASSFGASIEGVRELGGGSALGLCAAARFGTIPAAQASSRWIFAGVAAHLGLWSPSSRLRLALNLDVGVRQLSVTHLSADDVAPDRRIAYLPAAAATVRASLALADIAGIYGDAGLEGNAGSVDVNVHGATAATIPAVFGAAAFGVFVGF